MTRKLLDDCFLHDRDRLRHDEAIALLRARIAPVAGAEDVALDEAAGRILAAPVAARNPVPAHTNAAVDGYSFAASAYDQASGSKLPIVGRSTAGHPFDDVPKLRTAVRIFTGAVVPAEHDTVVMQEDTEVVESPGNLTVVRIPPRLKAGANVRKVGEDLAAGAEIMTAGHVLRPQDLAALASVGIARPTVFRRLRVAIVSSGDEIVPPDQPLARGQVHDANAPMLAALLGHAGVVVTRLGILPDRAEVVRAALAAAATTHDVILTTGGASRGEEDHMVGALDALGRRHFWQLAVKPGRPMLFGQVGDCIVVGLPGNPVAVFVCFLMYVWPMLRRLGGGAWPVPRRIMLPAAFTFEARKTGRREFWRGILRDDATAGSLTVDKFARDGSGLISGLRAADGLIDIPEDVTAVRPGDRVAFIPFASFGIPE